jgi:hypothetical protein
MPPLKKPQYCRLCSTKYFLSSLQILDQGDLSPGRLPGCVWDLSNVCLLILSCQALEYISLLDAGGVRTCVGCTSPANLDCLSPRETLVMPPLKSESSSSAFATLSTSHFCNKFGFGALCCSLGTCRSSFCVPCLW